MCHHKQGNFEICKRKYIFIYSYQRIIKENTQKWIECITKFKTTAQNSSIAANTAFTKSLQHEWIFLQQMIGHVDE